MAGRGELIEDAWASIAPLLSVGGRRGGQWRDHRTVINGILWKLRTRMPWRSVVARYEKCAVNSRALWLSPPSSGGSQRDL